MGNAPKPIYWSSLLHSELQPCGFGHRLAVTQARVGTGRNEDL